MSTQTFEEVTLDRGNIHAVTNGVSTDNGAPTAHAQTVASQSAGHIKVATAEELGAVQTSGPNVDVSAEHKASLDLWMDGFKAKVVGQAERYAQRLSAEPSHVAPALGGPTTLPTPGCPAGYTPFDVISFSPIEVRSGPLMPASPPSKILRNTDPRIPNFTIAAYLAFVFINPVPSIPCGYAVPPTIQLGGRQLDIRFDVMNVTGVSPAPGAAVRLRLGSPARAIIPVWRFFRVPQVNTATIYELNVTADIVESPQPYSAFATFHQDIDTEISIFGNVPPERQHDQPNRYMVYPF